MSELKMKLMEKAGYAAPELAGRAKLLVDLVVKECIDNLESCLQCDPYNGEIYDDEDNEVNRVLNREIAFLKEQFGVQ